AARWPMAEGTAQVTGNGVPRGFREHWDDFWASLDEGSRRMFRRRAASLLGLVLTGVIILGVVISRWPKPYTSDDYDSDCVANVVDHTADVEQIDANIRAQCPKVR
ncbi:MAG: hypothetical protein ACRDOY_04225, partial [Nocardioidaceae bacterium]